VNYLEVARLEKYLKFQLAEILQELPSTDEGDSNSTWSAKWGSSANVLKERLLCNREEIILAIDRIHKGTYGNCAGCGKEDRSSTAGSGPMVKILYCVPRGGSKIRLMPYRSYQTQGCKVVARQHRG